jgi:hypothetical protein
VTRLALLAAAACVAVPFSAGECAPGARIQVEFDSGGFEIGAAGINSWIERSATIVRDYYGFFPVRTLTLRIAAVPGQGVRNGRAFGHSGARIALAVGRATTARALTSDWVLVHEMVHLALPDVGEEHHWLSEGLATYVEGVARVQAGNMTAAELWQEYVESMPKGRPQAGDRGLDHTPTWARTYWGGALFCLTADVAIRERTAGRLGLQDALREIARQSGGMLMSWPIGRVLAVGDEATGTTVLTHLYAAARDAPLDTELDSLWARLGVVVEAGTIRLRPDAPDARLREALTRAPTPPTTPDPILLVAVTPATAPGQ